MEQMENYVSRNSGKGTDTCLSGTCIKSTDNEQHCLYAHVDVHLQTIMWLSIDVSANINCPMKFHWVLSCIYRYIVRVSRKFYVH